MNKKLKKWEIWGFVFVVLLGTLGHFLYDLSGGNFIVGKFFPVNESTWEHLKLLFFPYLIYGIAEWFAIGRNYKNFVFSKLLGALSGMVLIVVLFYTLVGVFGKTPDFINIGIFIVSAAVAFFVSYKAILKFKGNLTAFGVIVFVGISLLFILFTNNPPKINVFKDPLTATYGAFKVLPE